MQQRRPLKVKEIKFIAAKVAGKTDRAAAQEATGAKSIKVASVQANRMLSNVNLQEELQAAFLRHGITIDKATKPIADGLVATKTVIVRDKNAPKEESENSAFADEVPDHPTRLKAAGMAFNLMGLGKSNDGVTNNFIIITDEQQSKYGIN